MVSTEGLSEVSTDPNFNILYWHYRILCKEIRMFIYETRLPYDQNYLDKMFATVFQVYRFCELKWVLGTAINYHFMVAAFRIAILIHGSCYCNLTRCTDCGVCNKCAGLNKCKGRCNQCDPCELLSDLKCRCYILESLVKIRCNDGSVHAYITRMRKELDIDKSKLF